MALNKTSYHVFDQRHRPVFTKSKEGEITLSGYPPGVPRQKRRINVQEIAFAYEKEEQEDAISALQSTLQHGRQGDLDEQAVWRAARTVVSIVINVANGEVLFA